jgi:hypothetical protein
MDDLNLRFLGFNIIHGMDGSYVVRNGKLIKIIKVEYSDDWCRATGGWMKFYLEDGTILQYGSI